MEVYREARRPPEDVENLFECQLQSTFGCETVVHPHVHEQFEVLYCRKGGFELFSSGALTPFGPGDMVLIDPNEVHHTRSCTPGENEYQVVKFAPEALLYAEHPVYEMKLLLPYLWLGAGAQAGAQRRKRFERALLAAQGVDRLLDDILREFTARDPGYEMAVRADLCRLFLFVARVLRRADGDASLTNLDGRALLTLQKAFAYIDRRLALSPTMEEVAAHCGMKYSSFSRFFQRYARKSFPEYLTEARLKRACILLATTDQTVTDIAMRVGFTSTSYFIQCFRRAHGQTPGAFRRSFQSAP